MTGIRKIKREPQKAKQALVTESLVEIVAQLDPETAQGQRDRAMLLIGFAGAFRRSELFAINREDLSFTRDGVVVTIRHSKTDQEGDGQQVAIPRGRKPASCPLRNCRFG